MTTRRTRRWQSVAQEATRFADLGLTPNEIAARLNVDRSTVTRWMADGKLRSTVKTQGEQPERPHVPAVVGDGKTPSEWAAAVRSTYQLDATDEQLVILAESALARARDPLATPHVQFSAMGRFQSLVKQLRLVAPGAEPPSPDPQAPEPVVEEERVVRRPSVDPRRTLLRPPDDSHGPH